METPLQVVDIDDIDHAPLIDMQLVQERVPVIDGLKQIFVVFDHLAAHVDAKPLLLCVQLIAIEDVFQWQVRLCNKSRQKHGTFEAKRNRLKIW